MTDIEAENEVFRLTEQAAVVQYQMLRAEKI